MKQRSPNDKNTREQIQRELTAFKGTKLAEGALGYVLVVVRSLGDDRDPRHPAPGDSISIREAGLSYGEARVALEQALAVARSRAEESDKPPPGSTIRTAAQVAAALVVELMPEICQKFPRAAGAYTSVATLRLEYWEKEVRADEQQRHTGQAPHQIGRNMFYVNRQRLLTGLESVRRSICPYKRPLHGCDCKYGASLLGEQTGCPEVREAIGLIAAMTDDEFASLSARTGALDVGDLLSALKTK